MKHFGSGLNVSFHSNPKEEPCQRIFKLSYNCAPFTCQRSCTQNPSSQVSAVHEPRTSKYTSWVQKRQRNQRSNCQHSLNHGESREFQKNIYFCFTDYTKASVWITANYEKFLQRLEQQSYLPPEKPVCSSRSNSQNHTWNS